MLKNRGSHQQDALQMQIFLLVLQPLYALGFLGPWKILYW